MFTINSAALIALKPHTVLKELRHKGPQISVLMTSAKPCQQFAASAMPQE